MKTITRHTTEGELRGFRSPARKYSHAADGDAGGWDAFESLSQPVHIMTEDGVIVAANKAFEEMFGTPRRRFIGRHLAILNTFSVAVNLRILEQIRSEVCSCGAWQGTFRNQRADGTFFTSRALIHPMRLSERRYLVCFQDDSRPEAPAATARRCASTMRSLTASA